jgi:hypothetical protein
MKEGENLLGAPSNDESVVIPFGSFAESYIISVTDTSPGADICIKGRET